MQMKVPMRKTILLRHVGYHVIEAATAKAARHAVRAILPDVVVLDCVDRVIHSAAPTRRLCPSA